MQPGIGWLESVSFGGSHYNIQLLAYSCVPHITDINTFFKLYVRQMLQNTPSLFSFEI